MKRRMVPNPGFLWMFSDANCRPSQAKAAPSGGDKRDRISLVGGFHGARAITRQRPMPYRCNSPSLPRSKEEKG
ncbi:hypothetical protein [Novipirellula sp.]|uniref:hypothetical protein n=1 Tax=Novipirellula sp. TaxID=2795430 RepID=UPI00356260CF